MSARFAGALGLALILAGVGAAWSAERAVSKSDGGEGVGMYSHYLEERSSPSLTFLGNAGVEVLSAAELMPSLAGALDQLSKYQRPVAWPEVIRVPHERIEAMVCKTKCAALAVYRPGEGIYLDDRLKPESQLFDRSILLHELVHYVQDMSLEHDDMRPCQRWYQREQEAYAIQKMFLFMTGSPTR
ncbi:MAG: hypothetical protein ABI619_08910, partial [Betaproteobacteria bacterium]